MQKMSKTLIPFLCFWVPFLGLFEKVDPKVLD